MQAPLTLELPSQWTRHDLHLLELIIKVNRRLDPQFSFGLTQEEIIEAIKGGKLQFRKNYMHGNPYLRLVRSEVEVLVVEKHGNNYFKKKKLKKELAQINRDLRRMRGKVAYFEKRKIALLDELGE